MKPIEHDDLSDDLQMRLVRLELDVEDLNFEANFYRIASLIAVALLGERLWHMIF